MPLTSTFERLMDTYIAGECAVFTGIAEDERPKVTSQIKRIQRIHQVSTGPAVMTALLGTGLDSAHAIASMPRSTFVDRHQNDLGGEQQALQVYDRATRKYATTLHALTQLHPAQYEMLPSVMGTSSDVLDVIKTLPSYTDLFGRLDLCDCDQCRSVYSPAAYLVDLLQFLRNSKQNKAGLTPLDVLIGPAQTTTYEGPPPPLPDARRPDLQYIKLTCENTNRTMPYVDLVNEVLESYVACDPRHRQSLPYVGGLPLQPPRKGVGPLPYSPRPNDSSEGVTTGDLAANPENTAAKAYDALAAAVYPFTLPYNQPLEVARIYLDHLGSGRHEVMETFRKGDGAPDPTGSLAAEYVIAAEFLKISAAEFEIPTGTSFDGSAPPIPHRSRRSTARRHHGISFRVLQDSLSDVSEFLRRTDLSYLELIELLKMRCINPWNEVVAFSERYHVSYSELISYVNTASIDPEDTIARALMDTAMEEEEFTSLREWPKNSPQVVVLSPHGAQCDLSAIRLQRFYGAVLDERTLNNIQRFVRLWRKVGGTMRDLDRVISALQATTVLDTRAIDKDIVLNLARIKWMETDLHLPLAEVLSFWANIERQGDDSLYQKLCLSKAVSKADEQLAFKIARSQLKAAASTLLLNDHIPAILAAFRISEADLAILRVVTGTDADVALVNLENLSKLYRHVVLAKALKLTIRILSLKTLIGIDPFSGVSGPRQTADFVKIARKVQSSGFSIVQLNYLYRHLAESPTNLARRARLCFCSQSAPRWLGRDRQRYDSLPDPTGDVTRAKLGMIFDGAIVDPRHRNDSPDERSTQ